MKTIVKTVDIHAPPEAVWQRLGALDWQTWDPDLRRVDRVQGGFVEDGLCRLVMRNGLTFETRFAQVLPHHHARFTCTGYGRTLTAQGRFELVSIEDGTRFSYHFGMGGPWGGALMRLMPRRVDHAVQHCAEGLKRVVEAEVASARPTRLTG
jgi:carbon monoxide dehydrogenase subunit G